LALSGPAELPLINEQPGLRPSWPAGRCQGLAAGGQEFMASGL